MTTDATGPAGPAAGASGGFDEHLDDGLDDADLDRLRHAIRLAASARERGDHPFGAIVVAPDGEVVEGRNSVVTRRDPTGHAETNVVRRAASVLGAERLAASTLFTSTEPCAMCSGAIYWSGIRRIVYALSERALREIVVAQEGVPTLALPCREVFARGGRPVEVAGPAGLPEAAAVHEGFWG
ncbi:tRNA-specific adenosine deaminase [Agromyces rhizosphaerae]|uniref:tRNA-specific adenosine deaminase n=1 Tax=Agromyces rhizosphaerae TaxID=88374 RepID=A0A9W6CWF1_9MICO|nr:nucleoside deaminase [Agromyces rhizosphaerae]GLI27792.1 tRNA-specific adenosine deaminase [Agromyces rhizosphaerae]